MYVRWWKRGRNRSRTQNSEYKTAACGSRSWCSLTPSVALSTRNKACGEAKARQLPVFYGRWGCLKTIWASIRYSTIRRLQQGAGHFHKEDLVDQLALINCPKYKPLPCLTHVSIQQLGQVHFWLLWDKLWPHTLNSFHSSAFHSRNECLLWNHDPKWILPP